jgi:PAS domain S-box-containing protein
VIECEAHAPLLPADPSAPEVGVASAAVIGITADGRISRWDQRAEQIYGVSARQMIGTSAIHLAPGNDPNARSWLRDVTRRFASTADANHTASRQRPVESTPCFTTRAVRPDHSSAPITLQAGAIPPQQSPTVALIVVRQLGEHRPDPDAELHTLRARVKSLQAAVTTSRTVALVIDEDSLISHVANSTTLPSGWAPAQLLGRSPLDFVHPDDRRRASEILAQAVLEPGAYPPVVVRALTRAGEPIWVEAALTNALDDPDIRGVIGSFCDITDEVSDESSVPEHKLANRLAQVRFRSRLQHGLHDLDYERDLRIAYQPIVELATGVTIAFEALVRWHHGTLGVLAPDTFVPLAEASGEIVRIGRWVLIRACHDAVDHGSVTMSVNVSSRQLSRRAFVDDVRHALESSGLPAERLVLEVTETAVLDDWEAAAISLSELSAHGVKIAIDDFGTGYATLKHLKQLPANIIKIDRSFVSGLGVDDGDTAIVTSVIQLAHALGTETIAEGVETAAQRDMLLALGCTHAQGWLFGTPSDLP